METTLESMLENALIESASVTDTDVFLVLANGKHVRVFSDSVIYCTVEDE